MKTKRVPIVLTVIFFAGLTFLTFFARSIHDAGLPQVAAEQLGMMSFPSEYVDANGEVMFGTNQQLALKKALYDSGDVYIAFFFDKNGDERCFAKKALVTIGGERDGYYGVIGGIFHTDRVIVSTSKDIFDGAEIFITDE